MANRDVTEYRDVTQQVAPQTPNMYQGMLETVTRLSDISAEAKINKNISQAQLELNQLTNDFQLKNQSNPTDNTQAYQEARSAIFEKYGADISPIYKNAWMQQTRELASRTDLNMQSWQFKQSQQNVLADVNDSIKNNLQEADLNGQSYGSGKVTEIGSLLDFQSSYNRLYGVGSSVLGEQSAKSQLSDYKNKYVTEFLGGVASVNSEKAKALLEDEKISGMLTSDEKQNIMSKIIKTESVEQDLKIDNYKNKADEEFNRNPYNFITESHKISANGDAFRQEIGVNRKSYDAIVSYNNGLVEKHKNDSYFDFYQNPTKEGLDYLQKLKPEMTDTERDRLTDIYEKTPNFEMTTTFSGYEGALNDIKKMSLMPNETSKQKEEILNKSVEIVQKMKRSNLGTQDKASTLSQDDINGLSQTMYQTVNDSLFKKELADMPDISVFSKIYNSAVEPFVKDDLLKTTVKNMERANRIKEIGLYTSSNMVKALMNGDKETADKLYQDGLEQAIRQKYHYLPEMQGKLESGKTTFKINGKPYVFMGFGSEDIILEKLD